MKKKNLQIAAVVAGILITAVVVGVLGGALTWYVLGGEVVINLPSTAEVPSEQPREPTWEEVPYLEEQEVVTGTLSVRVYLRNILLPNGKAIGLVFLSPEGGKPPYEYPDGSVIVLHEPRKILLQVVDSKYRWKSTLEFPLEFPADYAD